MRKRTKTFIGYVFDECVQRGIEKFEDFDGKLRTEILLAAGKRCGWRVGIYYTPMNNRQILKRANGLLSMPDVQAGIREYFGKVADFSPDDAARKLVDHIEGRIKVTKTFVDDEGKPHDVEIPLPPNLQALQTYMRMAMPQPTKNVSVKQQTLVTRVTLSDEPPKTIARKLETIEALPE